MLRSTLPLARPAAAAAAALPLPLPAACAASQSHRLLHSAPVRLSSSLSLSRGQGTIAPPKPPTRTATLSTYRTLRRSIFQAFYTASQYASFDELAGDQDSIAGRSPGAAYRKREFARPENVPHVQFAKKRAEAWLKLIKEGYTSHMSERDPATLARLHRQSEDLIALLVSNMEHSRYLLEGGWGIRRDNSKTLTNVAHKVGLQLPKQHEHDSHTPAGNKHHKARDAKLNKDQKFTR